MNISLRQIRAFLAVARLGSFTRAAEALALTQPALTVQIRKLEESLDIRLFNRNTRKVSLTRVGASLVPVFDRMIGDLDAVISETRDLAAMRRGVVRIAVLPSVAAAVLPRTIKDFRALYPGASFVVHDLVADHILEQVREGTVDIGITGGDPRGTDLHLRYEKSESFKVIFPRGHALETRSPIGIADVAAFPLVALHASTSVRAVVDAILQQTGQPPVIACEATYMMTVAGMVSAGLGVAILPASARESHAFLDLVSAPIDEPSLQRTVSVLTLSGHTLPPMSELFCDHLIRNLETWDITPADQPG